MRTSYITASLAALFISASSSAYILVDEFDDAPSSLTDTTTSLWTATFREPTAAFGGTRAHFLFQTVQPAGGGLSTSSIGSGFIGTNTPETNSAHDVYYGAVGILDDEQGLWITDQDYDLSGETLFRIAFEQASANSTVSLQFRDSGPGEPVRLATYSMDLSTSIGSSTLIEFDRDAPSSIDTGFNWDRVDLIRLRVASRNGGSFHIDRFEMVPEPATLAAVGMGLSALVRTRSRRTNKRAR